MLKDLLRKKLRLKTGSRAALIAAPPGYVKSLDPLPRGMKLSHTLKGKFDWIQIFVRSKSELDRLAPKAMRALKPESMFWASFPKGNSDVQTDVTRDRGWDVMNKSGLLWVTLVSINETWSAFGLHPYRPGEKKRAPW